MRSEAEVDGVRLQAIADFISGRTDDISVGVGRLIWPMSVCNECGQVEDHSQGAWCSCWSPVSEGDLNQLSEMGVRIEDDAEDGGEGRLN